MTAVYDVLFHGYSFKDRKVNTSCLDLFLTTIVNADPFGFYKKIYDVS